MIQQNITLFLIFNNVRKSNKALLIVVHYKGKVFFFRSIVKLAQILIKQIMDIDLFFF